LVEAVMLVTLGFLVATLLAIAAVPALARRAERLARKRAEAAFPLSLAEIAADRDHLRAELALRARTLEEQAERGFAARAGAMQEIGRRDMTIAKRDREIGFAKDRIAALTVDLDDTRTRLASETDAHAATREALEGRIGDLAALELALVEAGTELAGTHADLASAGSELAHDRVVLGRVRSALALREEELGALSSEVDAVRVANVELRTRSLVLEAERDQARQRLAARETELAEADGALKTARQSHTEEVSAMREEIRTRDERLETLHAEIMMLKGALAEARSERASEARFTGAMPANDSRSALREEIVRIADVLMTLSSKQEAAE